MKGADSFGLPPRDMPGSILRSQVFPAAPFVGLLRTTETVALRLVELIFPGLRLPNAVLRRW